MNPLQQTFRTDSPVVLVTGSGAPRVGQAIAEHFASLRCNVALHAIESVEQAESAAADLQRCHGIRAIVTQGSLADEQVPSRLIARVVEAFGRLDVLVNSAAIWSPRRLENITADE